MSKYSYVVFGKESTGDRELDDIVMAVQNEIANTKLEVISEQNGLEKIALGEFVLSPNIHVSTEKWDGGHTYITITFYDYNTNQSIVVLKSSGIGLTISQDQNIALGAIRKKLKKVFGVSNRHNRENMQKHSAYRLTYALNGTGQLVDVDDVPVGNKCGCFCPACKEPLMAKNQGIKRMHHFAHQLGTECDYAIEQCFIFLQKKRYVKHSCQNSNFG